MQRRTFITTVASLSTAAVAGCGSTEGESDAASGSNDNSNDDTSGGSNDEATDTPEPEDDQPAVTILEHELVEDEIGNPVVEGKVENTSGEEQSYIGVEAKYFDEDGTRIDDAMWNATDVDAGRTLAFETVGATVEYSEVAEYEIEASTSAL